MQSNPILAKIGYVVNRPIEAAFNPICLAVVF